MTQLTASQLATGRRLRLGDVQYHRHGLWQLPFTGVRYTIDPAGFTAETSKALNLGRMDGLRQLGYETVPFKREATQQPSPGQFFPHYRGEHGRAVAALLLLVGTNNRLDKSDLLHLYAAGLGHDGRTPAGGDTSLLVSPHLDEDEHFGELLAGKEWETFARRNQIDPTRLLEIIQDESRVLGRLKDLCDKFAYTSCDVREYQAAGGNDPAVRELLASDPLVCGAWDSLQVVDGQVVSTDPERMCRFLRLRALMFKNIYFNPYARCTEEFAATMIIRFLYEHGVITRDELLTMEDEDLDLLIETYAGLDYFERFGSSCLPTVETFADLRAARRREAEVISVGNGDITLTMVTELRAERAVRTDTFPVMHNGKVCPLPEACPTGAAKVEAVFAGWRPVHLYHAPLREFRFPPELARQVAADHRQRLALIPQHSIP